MSPKSLAVGSTCEPDGASVIVFIKLVPVKLSRALVEKRVHWPVCEGRVLSPVWGKASPNSPFSPMQRPPAPPGHSNSEIGAPMIGRLAMDVRWDREKESVD